MSNAKDLFIRVLSRFCFLSGVCKNLFASIFSYEKLSRRGAVSSYLIFPLVLFAGLVGGFFMAQGFFSSSRVGNQYEEGVLAKKDEPSSLLASVSEVFQRSLGESPRHLDAEVTLSSSSELESFSDTAEDTSSSGKVSSTDISFVPEKETVQKKLVEKFSDCIATSTSIASREIIINELAWMGSPAQNREEAAAASRREWIELFNNSSRTISLTSWQLKDVEGKFKIIFPSGASLRPQSFYLLARGSAEKISGKKPDLLYSAALSNEGMTLKLFNTQCVVVDAVEGSVKWSAGNRETKQTMERDVDGVGWHSSVSPGGTPKAGNSVPVSVSSGGGPTAPLQSSRQSESPALESPVVVYPKLIITEVQTASVSSTHDEFVELYNAQDEVVDLTGWYLQKKTKSGSSYTSFAPKGVFSGQHIPSQGFLVIAHPSSSLLYNLSTDEGLADDNTLVLKNPDGEIVDMVGWGEAHDFEGRAVANPAPGESVQRKFAIGAFVDSDVNLDDFEVQSCPSPGKIVEGCTHLAVLLTDSATSSVPSDGENTTSSLSETAATSTDEGGGGVSSSTSDVASSTEVISPSSTVETSSTSSSEASSSSSQSSSTEGVLPNLFVVNHLVISEIQITGGTGKTENDFVRIFNPTSSTISMSGWKLRKRTQSGTETSIKVFSEGSSILSLGIFTWANSKDGFSETIGAHASSTQTLANDSSVGLFDATGNLIDAVAWGSGQTNPFVEGVSFSENPGAGQILKRKYLDGLIVDVDNNSDDFSIGG